MSEGSNLVKMDFALKRLLKEPNTVIGMDLDKLELVRRYKIAIDRKWMTEEIYEDAISIPRVCHYKVLVQAI